MLLPREEAAVANCYGRCRFVACGQRNCQQQKRIAARGHRRAVVVAATQAAAEAVTVVVAAAAVLPAVAMQHGRVRVRCQCQQ
jgi:hypothetical protein